jgi:hypothetical protein
VAGETAVTTGARRQPADTDDPFALTGGSLFPAFPRKHLGVGPGGGNQFHGLQRAVSHENALAAPFGFVEGTVSRS